MKTSLNASKFVLMSLMLLGCDSGVQRGQFVVSSDGQAALADGRGRIAMFTGTPAADLTAPDRLLVAAVFLGPDFSLTESSHETKLSSLRVSTAASEFDLTWNRSSEKVSIDGSEFNRTEGNVFLVRMMDGKSSVQQVAASVDSTEVADILTATKKAVPEDEDVQLLAPYRHE